MAEERVHEPVHLGAEVRGRENPLRHVATVTRSNRAMDGYFLRAESHFNVASLFGQSAPGVVDLHQMSHGESVMQVVNTYSDRHGRLRLSSAAQIVLGEYDRNEAEPGFALQQKATELLYPGNFSRKNTIGDRNVIANVTPEQMREIQRKYYVPNNCALIVTGDVNPERIFALAEEVFGDWPRGEDPFVADPIPPIPPLTENKAAIIEEPINTIAVLIQWQGPSVGKDPGATFAADVFSDALNNPGSTFQKNLVDSGLWHGILVNYYTLNHVGPISISGQTTPEKFREAMAALDMEIARFGDATYVSTRELEYVKAQRATSSAFGIEKASAISHTIGFWWSVANLDYFMGYVDTMAQQRITDLMRYTRTYIVGKPRVTNVLLPSQVRQQLRLTEDELIKGVRPGTQQ